MDTLHKEYEKKKLQQFLPDILKVGCLKVYTLCTLTILPN